MAPVACMTDFPMPRTDAAYPYTMRRRRNRFALKYVEKYRTDEIEQMSMARGRHDSSRTVAPSSRPMSSSDASTNAYHPNDKLSASYSNEISMERAEQWIILKRRAGLLNVIARTLDLMRRNRILEKKVEALKLQTRSFVNSIHDNREKTLKNMTQQRSSSFNRDDSADNSVLSTSDEKSSRTRNIVVKENPGVSRKNHCNDDNDRDSTISSLKRESRSTERMMVH